MYPREYAQTTPEKPALVFEPSGKSLSYLELERSANQAANFFRDLGLQAGDKVAFALENRMELFVFAWGAQRAGLIYVPISSRLTAEEIAYIIADSGARMLLSSDYVGRKTLSDLHRLCGDLACYTADSNFEAWASWAEALAKQPVTPIEDESRGMDMLYSSGTTGRPKGIMPKFDAGERCDAPDVLSQLLSARFGFSDRTIYLCPAPLYHAAPLRWCCSNLRLGATVIVMEKYDAQLALELIERHQITHAQFVPTHFIRMLKLEEAERTASDVSSLEFVVHAAAPCPVHVKQAMIDWWGPVINEYYAGSEGTGMTYISAQDWLTHKGSVGQSLFGKIHVCDPEGTPLPPGEEGLVYFESQSDFSYHNDEEKTAEAKNAHGWSTLGDIGKVDDDGFLYLTDRKSFMIISGGVNIYPQEIENHLIGHPKVSDVAVIGAPHPDMGEKVVAVVQPMDMADAGDELAEELLAYCRQQLSGVKVPRQFDFREALPRADTGKLYKKQIRAEYWSD